MTHQPRLPSFTVNGKEIHILGATYPDLTCKSKSWETPVMITVYSKQEIILFSF